jgi:hypothetical protein
MVEGGHWVCGFFHDVPQHAAAIACNMIKISLRDIIILVFLLGILANDFLSRQGRFCRRRVDLQRPSNKHPERESGITGIAIGQTGYFG